MPACSRRSPEPVWIEDEHYVPPPPPPLPRFTAPTILAMTILAMSILLLGLGGQIGLASNLTILLGVGGVLVAAGILVSRLRPEHDSTRTAARSDYGPGNSSSASSGRGRWQSGRRAARAPVPTAR